MCFAQTGCKDRHAVNQPRQAQSTAERQGSRRGSCVRACSCVCVCCTIYTRAVGNWRNGACTVVSCGCVCVCLKANSSWSNTCGTRLAQCPKICSIANASKAMDHPRVQLLVDSARTFQAWMMWTACSVSVDQ